MSPPMHPKFRHRVRLNADVLTGLAHAYDQPDPNPAESKRLAQHLLSDVASELRTIADADEAGIDPPEDYDPEPSLPDLPGRSHE